MGCGSSKPTASAIPTLPEKKPLNSKQKVIKNSQQRLWKQPSLEMRLLQPLDESEDVVPSTLRSPTQTRTFQIGNRVHVRGYVGTVKFTGATELGQGDWIGIEMDKEIDQGHNGSYEGIQYFICHPKRGVFARSTMVFPLDESDQNYNSKTSLNIAAQTVVFIQTNIRRYLKGIYEKKLELRQDIDKMIDKHVRSTPESAMASIQSLSSFLTEPWEGAQRSKAFAIYRWVTLYISFDSNGYFGKENMMPCDAESVLENEVSVSEGFANLFEALCSAANVPTRTVHGITKGYGYKVGESILDGQGRHSWNVIRVGGQWFICDCTLGSGYIGDDMMFHKTPNVESFMVSPDLAITDHFPDEEKWQLLDRAISKETFEELAVPSATMYNSGVRLDSHKTCRHTIDTDNIVMYFVSPVKNILKGFLKDASGDSLGPRNLVQMMSLESGKTRLQAYFPEPGDYVLEVCVLGSRGEWKKGVEYRINTSDGIGHNTGGFPSVATQFYSLGFGLEKPIQNIESDNGRALMYISYYKNEFTNLKAKLSRLSCMSGSTELKEDVQDKCLSFVEKRGQIFKIKVHVPQMGSYKLDIYGEQPKQSQGQYLCTYFINAFSGVIPVPGFPQVSDTFRSLGCQLVDKPENFEVQDGKASITLQHPKNIRLQAVLKKGEEEYSDMCFTGEYDQEKSESTVLIHAPDSGIFKVEIFARQEGKKDREFLCSYVIKSLKPANENPGFPQLSDAFFSWDLTLVEPLQNISIRNGRTVILIKTSKNVDIFGKLIGEDKKNIPGMCITKEMKDGREIAINTPTPGRFKLNIYGRRGKKIKKVLLGSYKIKSNSAPSENPGFPELTAMFRKWKLRLVDQFENISTDTGRAAITIETPGSILLSSTLRQNEEDLPGNLCFAERSNGQTKVSVHTPEAGLYQLDIYGREGPGSKPELLCKYSVFSCRGLGERAGFAHLDEAFRLWGLRLESNRENIAVYDGSVVITFLNPNRVELRAELLDDSEEKLPTVGEDQMEERMVYQCTLPKKGRYLFRLLGTNVAGSKDMKILCSYKIFY